MITQSSRPTYLTIRLGFWSALVSTLLCLIFIVCFITIGITSPVYIWRDLAEHVAHARQYPSVLPDLARLTMLIFCPLYVLLINCIHEITPMEKKILTRISLSFSLGFVVLVSAHYFVQLTTVRLGLLHDKVAGLDQVIQANAYGALPAMNVLGWSLFFGLSSLFVAPVFAGGGLNRVLRICFWVNGFSCLIGGIGYALENIVIVFFTLNFGMGGAITIIAIVLGIFFRRLEQIDRM